MQPFCVMSLMLPFFSFFFLVGSAFRHEMLITLPVEAAIGDAAF